MMWPWGHLAVAYLAYRLFRSLAAGVVRPSLTPGAVFAVAVGSQFPDLIDKPLAWTFGVLPAGRSLGHSLLTLAVVAGVVWWLTADSRWRTPAVAFLFGWLAHSLSDLGPDTVAGLLAGDLGQLAWATYLAWPLLPPPPYETDYSILAHFADLSLTGYVTAQFALLGLAVGLWVADGRPGYAATRTLLGRIADERV